MSRGFTLIELLVCLLVTGIVLVTSVPGVSGVRASSVLRFEAERFVVLLEQARARSYATRTKQEVSVTGNEVVALGPGGSVVKSYVSEATYAVSSGSGDRITFYPSGAASPASTQVSAMGRHCTIVVSLRSRIRSTC